MPKGYPATPRPSAAELAEASPEFQAAYARLSASGVFDEFRDALRLDVGYVIELGRQGSIFAARDALLAERRECAA